MARVILSGYRDLMSLMISALFFGESLHAITTDDPRISSRKQSVKRLLYIILLKASPSTTIAYTRSGSFSPFALLFLCSSIDLIVSVRKAMISVLRVYSILRIWVDWSRTLQEKPMLMAVSSLSPVSIQKLMPAFLIVSIVSPTSS